MKTFDINFNATGILALAGLGVGAIYILKYRKQLGQVGEVVAVPFKVAEEVGISIGEAIGNTFANSDYSQALDRISLLVGKYPNNDASGNKVVQDLKESGLSLTDYVEKRLNINKPLFLRILNK